MTNELEVLSSKYSPGDLVFFEPKRKFPLVLRSGPAYTTEKLHVIEPGDVAIILDSTFGHGMIMWVRILTGPAKQGWVPETIVNHLLNST